MELDRILLHSADELCRYVAARLKYRSACYSSSKLQWSGGILRCLNGMDCYLLFPVVSVRLLIVSEHRWLTLVSHSPSVSCLVAGNLTVRGLRKFRELMSVENFVREINFCKRISTYIWGQYKQQVQQNAKGKKFKKLYSLILYYLPLLHLIDDVWNTYRRSTQSCVLSAYAHCDDCSVIMTFIKFQRGIRSCIIAERSEAERVLVIVT